MVIALDWEQRRAAWTRRVQMTGAERAPYNLKRDPAEFAAVQAAQWGIVEPFITRAVCDAPFARARGGERQWLDFGCGAGRWTPWLADRYDVQVSGVDLTPSLLAAAQARPHPARGAVQFGDFVYGRIPSHDGGFDVLFAWTVLSAVLDDSMLRAVTDEWRRVLRPGGLVILLDNTSKVNGRPVRSLWSMSRTVEEYVSHFAGWCDLAPAVDFEDLGEINTLLLGRVR